MTSPASAVPAETPFPPLDLRAANARHVWHPMEHPRDAALSPPRIFASAEGCYVTDLDGNRVIDAVGGLWNVNLGYSCRPVKEAIARQLETLPYCSTFRGWTSPGVIALSKRLCEITAPEKMRRAFFTSGGSDSVETAMRLARQYWKVRGMGDRVKFMSFKKGYHGTHFGGASVNGSARFRRNYEPLLAGCFHMPFPEAYRNPFGISDPERLTDLCLSLIDDEIKAQGADTVAAFIAEPVLGAGGVYVPPPRLWKGLREICDRHEVLLIADEVITGLGRAGAWFGCRLWDVIPDMMCLAKALTTGYFPFGAVMVGEKVEDAFMADESGAGAIYHGYTYSGHPVGCAAALAALDVTFEAPNLPERAAKLGEFILSALNDLAANHPMVGEVRGRGLMTAVEMVSDRKSKAPADGGTMAKLHQAVYDAGASARISGNLMILSPPLVLSDDEARQIVDAVGAGLAALK